MHTRYNRARTAATAVAVDTRVVVWVGLLLSALVLLSSRAAWLPAT